MRAPLLIAVAAAALASLAPRIADAQGARSSEQARPPGIAAPASAFELTVATGYTQGFGTLQPGIGMPQIATAGLGVDVNVGYRIDPHYSVSMGGQYQELSAQRDNAARGLVIGLALQYHVEPNRRLDPWLELASGYRLLWLDAVTGPNVLFHGPQLVRLRAGLDVRVSPGVALAPVVGADASMFVFQDDVILRAIPDPTLSTFVFAGLQGRVDVGGR